MMKKYQNKIIKGEKEKYFFPDYEITIEAESREEAEKILKEKLAKKPEDN